MKTYFVSFLSNRINHFLNVIKTFDVKLGTVATDAGFTIVEIECTEEQANTVWNAGFHVAEQ